MKSDWFKIAIIRCLTFALMGCYQVTNPNVANNATPLPADTLRVAETQTAVVSPTQGDSTHMVPTSSTPVASGLDYVIEKAKEALAQRLSISVTRINLIEAVEVEWSDSSLDCPQPGMAYLQVLTPGYRIHLESGGNVYEYHSNRDTYVIYCENPAFPIVPKP